MHRDGAEVRALFSTAVAWVPFPDLVVSVYIRFPVSLTSQKPNDPNSNLTTL